MGWYRLSTDWSHRSITCRFGSLLLTFLSTTSTPPPCLPLFSQTNAKCQPKQKLSSLKACLKWERCDMPPTFHVSPFSSLGPHPQSLSLCVIKLILYRTCDSGNLVWSVPALQILPHTPIGMLNVEPGLFMVIPVSNAQFCSSHETSHVLEIPVHQYPKQSSLITSTTQKGSWKPRKYGLTKEPWQY